MADLMPGSENWPLVVAARQELDPVTEDRFAAVCDTRRAVVALGGLLHAVAKVDEWPVVPPRGSLTDPMLGRIWWELTFADVVESVIRVDGPLDSDGEAAWRVFAGDDSVLAAHGPQLGAAAARRLIRELAVLGGATLGAAEVTAALALSWTGSWHELIESAERSARRTPGP